MSPYIQKYSVVCKYMYYKNLNSLIILIWFSWIFHRVHRMFNFFMTIIFIAQLKILYTIFIQGAASHHSIFAIHHSAPVLKNPFALFSRSNWLDGKHN